MVTSRCPTRSSWIVQWRTVCESARKSGVRLPSCQTHAVHSGTRLAERPAERPGASRRTPYTGQWDSYRRECRERFGSGGRRHRGPRDRWSSNQERTEHTQPYFVGTRRFSSSNQLSTTRTSVSEPPRESFRSVASTTPINRPPGMVSYARDSLLMR